MDKRKMDGSPEIGKPIGKERKVREREKKETRNVSEGKRRCKRGEGNEKNQAYKETRIRNHMLKKVFFYKDVFPSF